MWLTVWMQVYSQIKGCENKIKFSFLEAIMNHAKKSEISDSTNIHLLGNLQEPGKIKKFIREQSYLVKE